MQEPLLPLFAALAAGIVLSRLVAFSPADLILPAGTFVACFVLCWWRTHRSLAWTSACLAMATAGVWLNLANLPPPPPTIDAAPGDVVTLTGCILEPSAFAENREQFTLEIKPAARIRVSLYLRDGEQPLRLDYGQRVQIDVRIRQPHNFNNPGSFDYVSYLARRDIYWLGSMPTGARPRALPGICGTWWEASLFRIRGAALDRLEALFPSDTFSTAMSQALLLGESTKLQKVWTENFRRTGTYHTLVISGLQVTLLAGLVQTLLRALGVNNLFSLAIGAIIAWLYASLCGWQVPVLRAAAGFSLVLLANYFYRRSRILNLLSLVAISFLLVDPGQLLEPSFQLTFLAVAALAAFAAPIIGATAAPYRKGLRGLEDTAWDRSVERRVAQFRVELRLLAETIHWVTRVPLRPARFLIRLPLLLFFFLAELLLTSAAVQFCLALPMILYFHRLSLSGLTANLLVIPLTSLAVPVGFFAIFTNWHWPAAITRSLLVWSQNVVDWHARWESFRIPDPPLWLALAFAASLILLYWRRSLWTATLSLAALATLAVHPFKPRIEPGSLELTAIDVGQGDSLFVAFPQGQTMILDGGGFLQFGRRSKPRLDPGEDVVSSYLFTRSVRRVDVVALSHLHEDHVGGLPAILENFRPRELWVGALPPGAAATRLQETARRLGVKLRALHRGETISLGGAQVQILAPLEDYNPAASPKNNDSLVLRLSYGRHSMLLTGDVERQIEAQIAADLPKTDLLKVAHHGSKTSSTEGLLQAAQPAFGVISAGFQNQFGHPHPDVVARLDAHHVTAFRTDEWGRVTFRTNGNRWSVETQRWLPAVRGLLDPF